MKTELMPYKRAGDSVRSHSKPQEKSILGLKLSKNSLIAISLAFLLGRVSFLGGMMPAGVAYYAASIVFETNRLLIALVTAAGMLTAGAREQLYIYAAAVILFNAINILFRSKKSKNDFRYAVIGFVSILVPHMVMVGLQGFLVYDFIKALFEAFIVFALTFIIKTAAAIITDSRRIRVFTNEEVISMTVLGALVLTGLGDIQFFTFSVRNILSILVLLIFTLKCGPGVGAAIGVSVGIIASVSGGATPLIIGTYAFCGLLCGILKKLGKIGVSLGFVMGNAILTLYMNGSVEVLIHLKEITAAVILFMLIPGKFIQLVAGQFDINTDEVLDKSVYSTRIKEMTIERLNKFSRAFKELAGTFNEISQTKVVTNKQDISGLFDRVADRVCKDCSVCLHCWDRNFYNTYQVMFKIVEQLDGKGRITVNDIPEYFLGRCERINEFVECVNSIYELFKVDMVWKSKLSESRGLVSQQLEGLSRIISNLAQEIDANVRFKNELEERIVLELNKKGVKASEAIAVENKWGKYEINVFHKGCGGKRSCIGIIEGIVSQIAGRKMVKESSECHNKPSNSSCSLRLIEEETFKVTTGIARAAKQNSTVSGDNYTFMNTGEGKFIIAISDGMGSGPKAALQSRATVSLLEQFMEAGFDKDTTINLINSILVLKSDEESFATIDLSLVDLYEGKVEFVKIGAAPTFIKRSGSVETIRSVSLPAGILSNVEVQFADKNVNSGDFIIMMTDGIVDSFDKNGESGVKVLQKFIEDIKSTNPQEIADMILSEACSHTDGVPFDDMTVLVAKAWKRAG
ncbi:MAG: stage II sporulation protein E [Clostridia bacterium]|nr:stage II sporulation protein E [Clostridia bacterium]